MGGDEAKLQWVRRVLGVTTLPAATDATVADEDPGLDRRFLASMATRLAGIEDRFPASVRARPELRSRLGAGLAMAQELVAAGNPARAEAVLDRLEAAMNGSDEVATARPPLPTSDSSMYELVAGDGQLVAYRKALLAWDGAKKRARVQLDGLKSEIASRAPELATAALLVDRVMSRLSDDLADTVDAAIGAADLGARSQHHRHAAGLARNILMRVNFDPVFRLVDTNPVRPLDLRGTLSAGLSQVLSALPA